MADAAAYDPLGAAGSWRRHRAKLVVYALLGLFALCYLLPLGVVILSIGFLLEDLVIAVAGLVVGAGGAVVVVGLGNLVVRWLKDLL